jgi:integrase
MSLGPVVPGVLTGMRKRALEILSRARIGQDVAGQKRAAAGKHTVALREAISRYLDEREPKLRPRYYAEIKRHLERDWKPLHRQAVDAVTRQAVVSVVNDIAAGQGDVAADRARTALSGFYGWAIDRGGFCEVNPTLNISPRAQNVARNRVLTEAELMEIWQACGDNDYGRIVRLLILTGQRRREISDLAWPEINREKRQLELPAERVKNGRAHLVPLSDQALAILAAVERRDGREFVFGRGTGGFSGYSKAKAELDARIATARKSAGIKKPMPPWVLHDLRRSFVTHINEHKIASPHVVEALVNHISGHLAGVAGVYNKALYIEERRKAVDLWGKHVAAMLGGSAHG